MISQIAKVVVGLPVDGPFDYAVGARFKDRIAVGQRVKVLFGRTFMLGIVIALTDKTDVAKLNPILDVLDAAPVFDESALFLARTMSAFYGCSQGQALEMMMPPILRKWTKTNFFYDARNVPPKDAECTLLVASLSVDAWEKIRQKISVCLRQEESVLILMPEQHLVARAQEYLSSFAQRVICLDQKIDTKAELKKWIQIKTQGPHVVIGSRSAVFLPVHRLGLVIVWDEDHEAYQEEQNVHYHAGQVARWRAKQAQCAVMMVSPAPTVETWYTAHHDNWRVDQEFVSCSTAWRLLDLANFKVKRGEGLCAVLHNMLLQSLEQGKRILIFLNRRGFSTMTSCHRCGFVMKCPRCAVNLMYHYGKKKLVCRHCQFKIDLPLRCPQCQADYLRSSGAGVEKVKSELARFYPQARIVHFDKEQEQIPKEADIVIGTQAILKMAGQQIFDMVAVLDFDSELSRSDYRSGHRAFALMTRLQTLGKQTCVVQTTMPDHYVLKGLQSGCRELFYKEELRLRQSAGFPPFAHLILVQLRGIKEEAVWEQANLIFDELQKDPGLRDNVFDPQASRVAKLRDQYRCELMIRASEVEPAVAAIRAAIKRASKKRQVVVGIEVLG